MVVQRIFNLVLSHYFLEENTTVITFEEIEKLRKTDRYFQWIHGNMFTELRRKKPDNRQFLTHALAYVIRERYSLLKEVFELKQFETLVHLDSCYYRPALEARRVIYQRAESLFNRYLTKYRYRSRVELPIILLELYNAQALNRKGQLYYANEDLFEEMLRMSEEFLTVSSPKI